MEFKTYKALAELIFLIGYLEILNRFFIAFCKSRGMDSSYAESMKVNINELIDFLDKQRSKFDETKKEQTI